MISAQLSGLNFWGGNRWVGCLFLIGAACTDSGPSAGPAPADTVLTLANEPITAIAQSPDRTLFVASTDGIYRQAPLNETEWVRLATVVDVIIDLYAPSRDVLFLLAREDRVYRRRALEDDLTDIGFAAPIVVDDHGLMVALNMTALWGRSENEVYVVGDGGAVFLFDGETWREEANPVRDSVKASGSEISRGTFWNVGGDSEAVYAVGGRVIRKSSGVWQGISALDHRSLAYTAVAPLAGQIVLAAGQCLYTSVDTGEVLVELWNFRDGIMDGSDQADGAVVVWNGFGDIAHVIGETAWVHRLDNLSLLVGGNANGDSLYAAGSKGDDGVVLRLDRASAHGFPLNRKEVEGCHSLGAPDLIGGSGKG